MIKSRIISIFSQTWCELWFEIDTGGHYSREFLLLVLFEKPDPVVLLIICQKMRKRWQMIGLLSINHSVKTKDKKTPGRRGEWTESSGHFYGRLRAVQGIRGLSYTGGYGRFRGEWVKQNLIHSVVVLYHDIVTFKKTQCRKHFKLLFQVASRVEHASLHAYM